MMGKRKPIAELVVAPRNAMTTLILVSLSEMSMLTTRITTVQTTFMVFDSFLPIISSMESFVGSTQKGVAKSTTKQMPNRER